MHIPKPGRIIKAAAKLTPGKIKKRVVAGAVAAATAVSLLTAASVNNPAELLDDKNLNNPPVAIVETYVPDTPPDDDGSDGLTDEQEEKKRMTIRARIRALLLRLPLAVRVFICVPMWCAGWALSSAAGGLGTALMGPVGGAILRTAISAATVFALILLNVKTIAPDIPVKKLLNRKTAVFAVLAAVLAELTFVILELCMPEGQRTVELIKSLCALLMLLAAAVPFTVRSIKKHKQA